MRLIAFFKSYNPGYTRKDGTVVRPFSDGRTKRAAVQAGQASLFDEPAKPDEPDEHEIKIALPDDTEEGEDPVAITAYVDGVAGNASIFAEDNADGSYSIQEAGLPEELRGKGLGIKLYEKLIADLFARGKRVTSDNSVSADAQHVYDALRRRGYTVEQNPDAEIDDETGALESWDTPVFEIKKPLAKAVLFLRRVS